MKSKVKWDVKRTKRLYRAGKNVNQIAKAIAYKPNSANNRVRNFLSRARLHKPSTKYPATCGVVPLPALLVDLLSKTSHRVGWGFSDSSLRTGWERACTACGLDAGERVQWRPRTWHRTGGATTIRYLRPGQRCRSSCITTTQNRATGS
jgi:hypothetical protein